MEISLVLVDFDDTLVETAPRFQQARDRLFEVLCGAGFELELCRRVHHEEVEPELIESHGLGPSRLELSFRETYRRLCARHGLPADPRLARQCAAFGRAVLGTPPAIDGALDALRALARALPTALYTQAGDPDYQLRCVHEAGVLHVLPPERVRICRRKTTKEFAATLAHFGVREPATAWMVGNSMRSDVNPALSAGARAILVEIDEPWEFDQEAPVSTAFLRVRSFAAAADHLLKQAGLLGNGRRAPRARRAAGSSRRRRASGG